MRTRPHALASALEKKKHKHKHRIRAGSRRKGGRVEQATCKPDEHWRLMVVTGTVWGISANSCATRAIKAA